MSTSSRCPHYRFFATTKNPRTSYDQFFGHAVKVKVWCKHPNSTYPEDKEQHKLPCGSDLEKCTILTNEGKPD